MEKSKKSKKSKEAKEVTKPKVDKVKEVAEKVDVNPTITKITLEDLVSFGKENEGKLYFKEITDGKSEQWHKTETTKDGSETLSGLYGVNLTNSKNKIYKFDTDTWFGLQVKGLDYKYIVAYQK